MKKAFLLFYLTLIILFPKTQFAQWTTVLDDGKYYIVGIEFKDENTGFAGGYNMESDSAVIIRTLDGGDTWHEVYTQSSYIAGPYCFDFINDSLFISGGQDGTLFKTTDGGSNWEYYSIISGTNDINNIHFFNDTIGIATFSRTIDGGYNWENMGIGNTKDYFLINDSSVFASSSSSSGGGIYYTDDFGENWLKVDTCQNEAFISVCMATDLVGYAVTVYTGKIYKSIDGGMSWYQINSLPDYEIKQIRFTDENNGYLLANTNMSNYGGSMRLLKTTDGGESWDFVLFGTDYSFQMALVNEETILVPTRGGIMYKTTNGGGDPILPRHTEIDWYSKLKYSGSSGRPPYSCINTISQPYLMSIFKDTVFVNDTPILIPEYPQNYSTYILRYNTWGSLDWYTIVEKSDKDIYGKSAALDNNNNYYLIYRESELNNEYYTTNLTKYSNELDSLWTIVLDSTISLSMVNIKSVVNEHIIISGSFTGTFSFGNNTIHTDNVAIFILELDQDGNFINLVKVIEAIYYIDDILFDINNEGSICLSFNGIGSVYINSDTLDPSSYYLLYLDQNANLLWYNSNFDEMGKYISNILFTSNSNILLRGNDVINGNYYKIVYQYDEQGIKTDSTYISTGSSVATGNSSMCISTNNKVITSGNYKDFSVLENDTLYGFSQYSNSFMYTLSDELEFFKSSHITGTYNISSLIENQQNTYAVGKIDGENIIFANDTIEAEWGYFIAKLNSIITPVSEKDEYNSVLVYPNPTTGLLTLVFPEGSPKIGFIEIYNITGQKVYEGSVSKHNHTLDLSKLKKGIYFIQLSLDKMIYSEKIIIQ